LLQKGVFCRKAAPKEKGERRKIFGTKIAQEVGDPDAGEIQVGEKKNLMHKDYAIQ
jgi:hypothetical protein